MHGPSTLHSLSCWKGCMHITPLLPEGYKSYTGINVSLSFFQNLYFRFEYDTIIPFLVVFVHASFRNVLLLLFCYYCALFAMNWT